MKKFIVLTFFVMISMIVPTQGVTQIVPKKVAQPTKIITVQPGETLADLAEKYFGDRTLYKKFLEYNEITDINRVSPGDQLQVPIGSEKVIAVPTTTKTENASPPPIIAQADPPEIIEETPVITIAPPTDVRALDTPNDAGKGTKKARGGVIVTWTKSADDVAGGPIEGYHIFRKTIDGDFEQATKKPVKASTTQKKVYLIHPSYDNEISGTDYSTLGVFVDRGAKINTEYVYKVTAIADGGNVTANSDHSREVIAIGNWFNTSKIAILFSILFVAIITLFYLDQAQSGREMFVRKIAALDAFENSVGRAAEMGRPVLFIPGNDKIDQPSALAAINIFESVANFAVVMQTQVRCPIQSPIIDQVMQNNLKTTYLYAGRPDLFQQDDVHFDTDNQLAYAADVCGVMERENPAAIFIQGDFGAESLIFAESGNAVGAIQIAGTDNPKQLPYFIAACDYTLIAEELYAAGAYVKKDPLLISTLKAQDALKLLIFTAIIFGTLIAIMGGSNFITAFFSQRWFDIL